ncbi:DUF4184 family protein [Promicromonospora sp. NPDC052451]|uniref:DUF4184 family protein n=1 Tax=Promicromonospora sp. NPDC052451 TaxID=3364407 RepID=UPI0037C8A854
MPFTLSHPAAVLPLLRRPFSAVALMAGAVAPDLPYFARRTPIPVTAQSWYEPYLNATTSHGLVGALTVSLPYAVALCGLYWVARRPVRALLVDGAAVADPTAETRGAGSRADGGGGATVGTPRGVGAMRRRRFGAVARRAGWVLLSLLIGVATHLLWDSFTHSDGYVVQHVPALTEPVAAGLTWARALQHVSTVVGLVLVAVYLWRRRTRLTGAVGGRVVGARTLWVVGVVVVAGASLGTIDLWEGTGLTVGQTTEAALAGAATGAGAALVGGLVLYVTGWWIARGLGGLRRARTA